MLSLIGSNFHYKALLLILLYVTFSLTEIETFSRILSDDNTLNIKVDTNETIKQKRDIFSELFDYFFYDDSEETDEEKYLICRNCSVVVQQGKPCSDAGSSIMATPTPCSTESGGGGGVENSTQSSSNQSTVEPPSTEAASSMFRTL